MNKLISKIVGVALGLSLAVGTGVAIGANSNDISKADAATELSFTLTSNPGGWPTANSTTETAYTYTLDNVNYEFTTKNVKCNSGYLMCTSTAALGLPKISGSKLTKVVVYNSSSCSTTTKVGISSSSSSASYVTGGGIQTWSTQSSSYTYNLTSTLGNTRYYIYVTNKNAQILKIDLTYESAGAVVSGVTINGDMDNKAFNTLEAWDKTGLTASVTMSDSSSYSGTVDWEYDPASPIAYALSNEGEVANGTLKVTAKAGGKSAEKNVTGISVSYATVAQATAATPSSGTLSNVIVKGIVSQIDSIDTTQYFNATYYISDDGTTTGQYEVFRGKGINNANFTNANDLKVGDTVVVYGSLTTYNGTKEFAQGNYLLSLDRPASTEPSITITDGNFSMKVGDADVTLHETHENLPSGGSIKWSSSAVAVATVGESNGVVHAVAPGTATIYAKIFDSNDVEKASNSIMVTVIQPVLSDGDTFVIKAVHDNVTYYLTGVTSNSGTTSTDKTDAMVFTAIEGETSGQFQFNNGTNYLAYSGSSNEVKISTDSTAVATLWTALDNGTNTIVESVNVSGRKLQFNYNNGNPKFACYTSVQEAISIEKVVAPEVDEIVIFGDSTADAEGAVSVTKEFLYEVGYVDPNNIGNSGVTVSVLNSNNETSGASVTSGPANGAFEVTFTASDTYTITVTSTETVSVSESTTIVVSNIYVAAVADYSLYSGTMVSGNAVLTEGDYVIYYNGYAANTTVASSRIQYEEVTPTDDVISTNLTNIVWHIAPAGEYYTIYNAVENKYLAGTAKNNAGLIEDGTDERALWTVTIDNGTFEFENLARSKGTNPDNKWLRNNGTYGFACYATGTGGALSLYKKAYDAVDYSKVLLNYLGEVCDAVNGNTDVSELTATWAILSAEYANLTSSVKNALNDESSSTNVLNALAAYDYVVGKYNKGQSVSAITDFMNRNPVALSNPMRNYFADSSAAATIVIITAVLGITTIGGYFFLRKKKEN